MATKNTKPLQKLEVTFSKAAALVEPVDLDVLTETNLRIYGEEVNLDRSVPDFRDGLKPVTRRLLWSLHTMGNQMVKTARLGGDTVGKYHPHGEASVYGAIGTQVVTPTPPITGVGNWGSIIDRPGAPRYTNIKMSAYGKTCFFDTDYLPLMPKVDNYDGKDKEPLFLPATLPNLLLNGIDGIGLGLVTSIPAFTPKSLLPLLADLALGKVVTPQEAAKRLVPYHEYGGEMIKDLENRKAMLQLMEEPKASLKWLSPYEVDEVKKQITLTKFGPGINPLKLVDDFLKPAREVASVHTGKGVSYIIQCRRDINMNEFRVFVEKLKKRLTTRQSYDVYITRRSVSEKDPSKYDVGFKQVPLMALMKIWVKYRVELEVRSITHRINLSKERINYYDLLLFACANLDVIFKSLRSPDPTAFLMKNLKLTKEQADTILNLKVRQLSKLDGDDIGLKKAAELNNLKGLEAKLKIPGKIVAEYLNAAADKFKLVVSDWSTQWVL